jgi:hypothetical protein
MQSNTRANDRGIALGASGERVCDMDASTVGCPAGETQRERKRLASAIRDAFAKMVH